MSTLHLREYLSFVEWKDDSATGIKTTCKKVKSNKDTSCTLKVLGKRGFESKEVVAKRQKEGIILCKHFTGTRPTDFFLWNTKTSKVFFRHAPTFDATKNIIVFSQPQLNLPSASVKAKMSKNTFLVSLSPEISFQIQEEAHNMLATFVQKLWDFHGPTLQDHCKPWMEINKETTVQPSTSWFHHDQNGTYRYSMYGGIACRQDPLKREFQFADHTGVLSHIKFLSSSTSAYEAAAHNVYEVPDWVTKCGAEEGFEHYLLLRRVFTLVMLWFLNDENKGNLAFENALKTGEELCSTTIICCAFQHFFDVGCATIECSEQSNFIVQAFEDQHEWVSVAKDLVLCLLNQWSDAELHANMQPIFKSKAITREEILCAMDSHRRYVKAYCAKDFAFGEKLLHQGALLISKDGGTPIEETFMQPLRVHTFAFYHLIGEKKYRWDKEKAPADCKRRSSTKNTGASTKNSQDANNLNKTGIQLRQMGIQSAFSAQQRKTNSFPQPRDCQPETPKIGGRYLITRDGQMKRANHTTIAMSKKAVSSTISALHERQARQESRAVITPSTVRKLQCASSRPNAISPVEPGAINSEPDGKPQQTNFTTVEDAAKALTMSTYFPFQDKAWSDKEREDQCHATLMKHNILDWSSLSKKTLLSIHMKVENDRHQREADYGIERKNGTGRFMKWIDFSIFFLDGRLENESVRSHKLRLVALGIKNLQESSFFDFLKGEESVDGYEEQWMAIKELLCFCAWREKFSPSRKNPLLQAKNRIRKAQSLKVVNFMKDRLPKGKILDEKRASFEGAKDLALFCLFTAWQYVKFELEHGQYFKDQGLQKPKYWSVESTEVYRKLQSTFQGYIDCELHLKDNVFRLVQETTFYEDRRDRNILEPPTSTTATCRQNADKNELRKAGQDKNVRNETAPNASQRKRKLSNAIGIELPSKKQMSAPTRSALMDSDGESGCDTRGEHAFEG